MAVSHLLKVLVKSTGKVLSCRSTPATKRIPGLLYWFMQDTYLLAT